MSDTRAVVLHNSYATGTEKLRITKIATHSPAIIFVEGHGSISASAVSVNDTMCTRKFCRPHRPIVACGRADWLSESFSEFVSEMHRCCCCFDSLIIPSFVSPMFEKHSKHMKGFGRKLLSRLRRLSLAPVGRCSSVVSARE